ncbi:hypothetical protein [Dictyobacter kobayashii]|uniref:Uncharacterized protein n=1 Tax=Dictyobacter kobayashii TaxID=2014872 RepID=A0A402AIZ2_9CHLR|nr:hypothetical protein [Dictyobacter kobayashii]GCE19066.1 hypothetical protein KDK_28660 [Dictyobacter kobayashii]
MLAFQPPHDTMSTETEHHVIEVSEGWLTIGGKTFPDDCVSLSPQEAEATLQLLLQWKADQGNRYQVA